MVDVLSVVARSGVYMGWDGLLALRDAVVTHCRHYRAFLVICGTDSMEEVAFALELLIDPAADSLGRPVVVTGAMKPHDVLGYDGHANLRDALAVCLDPHARGLGTLVVMNDAIHAARYVQKLDSQLIGSFSSLPAGPLGQIRNGRPLLYHRALPPFPHRPVAVAAASKEQKPWRLRDRVLVWPITLGCGDFLIPDHLLRTLDGLVLSGMGTGTIPDSYIEHLSPEWTSKLAIVIVSRCPLGQNYDDFYYRGSLRKYTDRGFLVTGYEDLNPLQARLKLIVALSLSSITTTGPASA